MPAFVEMKNVSFERFRRDEEGNITSVNRALDGITLDVKAGEFIAILGHNGSGKSTLARHLNALLFPTEGTVLISGNDTSCGEKVPAVRRLVGMVFQNPDNQLVANVVEEDVAFGPENVGIPTEQIRSRVTESLRAVDMEEYKKHSPNRLSGGQKQKVAIAGVMAMKPKCIVLDEATAMLDPAGRREVLETAHRLNKEEGITIIWITHYMDEVTEADRIVVTEHGSIVMQGSPREIFAQGDKLLKYHLILPDIHRLALELAARGLPVSKDVLTKEELLEQLFSE